MPCSLTTISTPTFQLTHLLRGATCRTNSPESTIFLFQLTHLLRGATSAPAALSFWPSNFNSRTSCEVRRGFNFYSIAVNVFQLTHLLRGATRAIWIFGRIRRISTHAPLARCDQTYINPCLISGNFNSRTSCEVRLAYPFPTYTPTYFNSRTSCEVRQRKYIALSTPFKFQLTHLLRGATISRRLGNNRVKISTHAPLARCDMQYVCTDCVGLLISTHAPLARCDVYKTLAEFAFIFQLTHLLRGATQIRSRAGSYHAFQLTHLLRGATVPGRHAAKLFHISTHAPLARCDFPVKGFLHGFVNDFNSRTSCEVRHNRVKDGGQLVKFQLTHLLRGATYILFVTRKATGSFQLTHLLRGATMLWHFFLAKLGFQLTHLLRGATKRAIY